MVFFFQAFSLLGKTVSFFPRYVSGSNSGLIFCLGIFISPSPKFGVYPSFGGRKFGFLFPSSFPRYVPRTLPKVWCLSKLRDLKFGFPFSQAFSLGMLVAQILG